MHITHVATSETSMRVFAHMRGGYRMCPGHKEAHRRTDCGPLLTGESLRSTFALGREFYGFSLDSRAAVPLSCLSAFPTASSRGGVTQHGVWPGSTSRSARTEASGFLLKRLHRRRGAAGSSRNGFRNNPEVVRTKFVVVTIITCVGSVLWCE